MVTLVTYDDYKYKYLMITQYILLRLILPGRASIAAQRVSWGILAHSRQSFCFRALIFL